MIEKKYLGVIGIIAFFTILIAASLNVFQDEISNNVTLVAEIGVGFVIAVIVYAISRKSEKEIEEKINEVFSIVKQRETIQKEKETQVYSSIITVLQEIQNEISQVLIESEDYRKSKDVIERKSFKDQIELRCKNIRTLAEKNLDDPTKISTEFFDFDTQSLLKTISDVCKNEPRFGDKKNVVDVSFCKYLKTMIEPRIIELSTKIKKPTKEITKEYPELEANTEQFSISTSADRTVYPLGSTIHVRANLPYVKKGKDILFQIFNSKRKLLLSQHIDPTKSEHPELAEANIFQASFKMEGDEWKAGETYIVRATHDSSFSEDAFVIDRRMPVVQSDKSVYMINSDMVLTVIDPDADKDNNAPEIVGDREDSKLILESKYGKIDGYRLRETGDSTGIFQGVVGILGIRKDGSVIPRYVDGKKIDKIQGTGLTDGFIGGAPGDEIIISYKNKTGVAYLTVFVSNFGATIEMDQKVYAPNDKVYLTVVAPDFNFDAESIDEIGQNPESLIQIRTKNDELSDYKLVETGPDTGIFIGELQLTESINKSVNRSQTKFGPNDGIIVCDKDDYIEVLFNYFGYEEIVGRALIKS